MYNPDEDSSRKSLSIGWIQFLLFSLLGSLYAAITYSLRWRNPWLLEGWFIICTACFVLTGAVWVSGTSKTVFRLRRYLPNLFCALMLAIFDWLLFVADGWETLDPKLTLALCSGETGAVALICYDVAHKIKSKGLKKAEGETILGE